MATPADLLGHEAAALYRGSYDLRIHDGGGSVFARQGLFFTDELWVERAFHAAAKLAETLSSRDTSSTRTG